MEKIVLIPKVTHSLGILGLMFRKNAPIPLLFKKKWFMGVHSIHGFFMNFTVDVLFLDDKNIVVDKAQIKPYTSYTSKIPGIVYAIESVKNDFSDINLGDTVLWN